MKEGKTILIVDDDATHRFMLKRIVGSWGYCTCEAEDGESALQMIGNADFSLVLLDIRMEGLSGLDVLAEIRNRRLRIPIILMTAFCSADDAARAERNGAAAVLYKPLHIGELKNLISRCIESELPA